MVSDPSDPLPGPSSRVRRPALLGGAAILGALLVAAGAWAIIDWATGPSHSRDHAARQRLRTERARAWSARISPIVSSLRSAYEADAAFRRRALHHGDSAALRSKAQRQRIAFSHALKEMKAVPAPHTAALRRSGDDLRRALALFARGYAEFGAGRLSASVTQTRRARRLLQAWSAKLNAISPLFYGAGDGSP
jgi:hypothetical protein